MPLKLMYITNRLEVALIAQETGVDRIFIDLETLGKEARQGHMNSVKSNHKADDIALLRPFLNKAELLVRVNPLNSKSKDEIDAVIRNGADIIMLPMWKEIGDVENFIHIVDGRAKVNLLLETKEADSLLDDVLDLNGVDEVHIGLNDLHLSYGKTFMFELLSDGTVERICNKLARRHILYGFGGIARIGYGTLPAEYILAEHCRLGSSMVILSRSFCDANQDIDLKAIHKRFEDGILQIRQQEQILSSCTKEQFAYNVLRTKERVEQVVCEMKGIGYEHADYGSTQTRSRELQAISSIGS